MKRLFTSLTIAASAVFLAFCTPTPSVPAPTPPTTTPTSACTLSSDCISSGTPMIQINSTPFSGQGVTLNVKTEVVTNSSGTATVTFPPQGICTVNSLDPQFQMVTQITTRPDNATIFSQDQGTSYCDFPSAPNKKPVVAGKVVTIQFPDDPAIRIIVTRGNEVRVAVYVGRVLITVDQAQREVRTKQEAKVDLSTHAINIQEVNFTTTEEAQFREMAARLGVSATPTLTITSTRTRMPTPTLR